jgi:single-strand DNA-binding protein
MNYNRITLVGRLVADPVLLTRSADNVVARFSLAVNRISGGESVADFFDCVAFRQNAEYALSRLKKGTPVIVEGSLRTRTYQTRAGERRKAYEVVTTLVRSLAPVGSSSVESSASPSDAGSDEQALRSSAFHHSVPFEEDFDLEDPFA